MSSRLPRQVKLFGAVSLLNDFASEMIYPLLPAFLTGVLGAGPQALGALDGAAALAGRAFGLQRGMDHAGAVLGPLVAWYLLASGSANVRAVIGWSLVPGVAVLVLAVWAVKKSDGKTEGRKGDAAASSGTRDTPVLPFFRHSVAFFIPAFYLLRMPDTLIILRSQQLGIPVAVVPLLWAAVHVVRSSSSFLGGAATDRLGPGRTMWVGWLAYAVLALGLARATTAAGAWALFLGMGLVAGLTESPERALVARFAGGRQGSGFGFYHGATGLAALVGGLALGAVYQAGGGAGGAGGPRAFIASATLGGLLALVSAAHYLRRKEGPT